MSDISFHQRELGRIAVEQSSKAAPFNVLIGGLVALRFWDPERAPIILGWFGIMLALVVFRLVMHHRFFFKEPGNIRFAQPVLAVAAGLGGLCWGLTPWVLAVEYGTVGYYELLVVIAGMAVGGAISFSIFQTTYILYAVPMLVPFILTNLMQENGQLFVAAIIGFLGFIFYVSHAYRGLIIERTHAIAALRDTERDAREMAEKALGAADAKSRFLATMSHEIRTPLNSLLGMARMMLDDKLEGEQQRRASTIVSSGETLLAILADVLDLSKIDAGGIELKRQPASLGHLLEMVEDLWREQVEQKGLRMEVEVAPGLPEMMVFDQVRVNQVVGNLVSNAAKFTHEGEILVSASAERRLDGQFLATIEVIDTGIGIAQGEEEAIFDDFYQLDNSTDRVYDGAGLGLAITRRLARLMDGDVRARNNPDGGSTFIFTFIAEAVLNSGLSIAPTQAPEAKAKPLSWPGLRGKRIMVCDDNAINREVAAAFLESEGVETIHAENGMDALAQAETEKLDAILLDMRMPVMDGPETLERLRDLPMIGDHTPILAVTADVVADGRIDYTKLPIQGYVPKPFDKSTLLNAVQAALDAMATGSEVLIDMS
ncbi:MAG: response regulator [Alphaproteobacteria bacterium]|nr:response regulator [Alphaproteobacteria bacterium SS10]